MRGRRKNHYRTKRCPFLKPWNYIDSKGKCLHLKKFICKGTLKQVFICPRPPPLLGFFILEWSSNFAGSESGQIQCVNLLQNMVSNRTQPPPPPPSQPTTVCTVILYFDTEKGEGGELNQRRLEGQQFTKLGRINQHD